MHFIHCCPGPNISTSQVGALSLASLSLLYMQCADGAPTESIGSLVCGADDIERTLVQHHLSTCERGTASLMTLPGSAMTSCGAAVLLSFVTAASMGKIGVTDDDSIVVC